MTTRWLRLSAPANCELAIFLELHYKLASYQPYRDDTSQADDRLTGLVAKCGSIELSLSLSLKLSIVWKRMLENPATLAGHVKRVSINIKAIPIDTRQQNDVQVCVTTWMTPPLTPPGLLVFNTSVV